MDSFPAATMVATSCACKAFQLTITLPASSIPHERALCLCGSCRRFSGSLGTSYLLLPKSQKIDPTSYSLRAYPSSERTTRYFCSTCGAHTVSRLHTLGSWALTSGLLERTEGIMKWMGCKWVEDTLDGGLSVWFNSIVDPDGTERPLKRWKLQDGKEGELVPAEALRKFSPEKQAEAGEERLKVECSCGGVKFYITRPNAASKTARSPFPDLMVPYHSASPANPENKTWWLRAGDTKYLAGTCTCASCRLASGFEIQPWAFIPKSNIFREDGQQMDYEMGTSKRYASSEGVSREFCGVCGATVFWHCKERPELVDVSVGLLDPAGGARVESWLEWWTERVSFEELAVSRSLVRSLEEGLKEYADKGRITE
ncbi:hypothetical protein D0Z07_7214 [Hyphodiscus hymeniophilus]|uniref:CENP-V/GFA domain-containing protein n=1 Tax=Hyphodiscus hymeniophilus TaxID=353542 RepID=A0A9P6VGC9_9HELO|nr:hypothetical protein D0Z07_7214 [Hyphodiscus hymeniophilus]